MSASGSSINISLHSRDIPVSLSHQILPMSSIDSVIEPLRVQHLWWDCRLPGSLLPSRVLIDTGAHITLIRRDLVDALNLRVRKLPRPEPISVAMTDGVSKEFALDSFVNVSLGDSSLSWRSRTGSAIVAETLCAPMIIGLNFLSANSLVIDAAARTVVDCKSGFDLLNPTSCSTPRPVLPPPVRRKEDREAARRQICEYRHAVLPALAEDARFRAASSVDSSKRVSGHGYNVVAAIKMRIDKIQEKNEWASRSTALMERFSDVFDSIPHADALPTDILCDIKLKHAFTTLRTRGYSSPRKYKDAWSVLIQKHLDAGRIQPSSSAVFSPAFLIPKSDPSALPRWVNDYRNLNSCTVPDRGPLVRIDSILSDCRGKVFGKMDMTDSFFQTRMEPSAVPLTAVMTPLGLYEWRVMPQGFRNAPSIQQRRVTAALRRYIGRFCHVYLDDIIIWSNTVEEHEIHVTLILEALRAAGLYCNPKKCMFFQTELDFLGHHISERGVEAMSSKIDAVLNYPVPKSSKQVRRFLGMVRFIAHFLRDLAEYTRVLTPLTKKECDKSFPDWTFEHQEAFDRIKRLVLSREVLTTINYEDPGDNKIFLVTDASDWRTGAVLMWGPDVTTARPVAFDSAQMTAAELNYPVHEKEMLAIIRALKKFRSDVLGMPIYVLTDHKTLENFTSQKDLSRRQLRWQEFLGQYDVHIAYIRGEDNPGADAFSRLPPNCFSHERFSAESPDTLHEAWLDDDSATVAAVLRIEADNEFLRAIKEGYEHDPWVQKIRDGGFPKLGLVIRNGLWYVGERLVVPEFGNLRETIFRLAHDNSGHFGSDKSYDMLRGSYYWPKMRKFLVNSYIPGCEECQRNKDRTAASKGPLHPLPVPDRRFDSVAIDFVGPLPVDEGFDYLLTMTDRLNADLRVVPCCSDLNAEDAADLFFSHWYCENGLPLEIVCDRDKLWTSDFWAQLHRRTGISLKLSSSYHPESDGSSERSNKTINQALRYHVSRSQQGWVRSLPLIRFQIMNSLNASTDLSMFELRFGRSARVLPPLLPVSDAASAGEQSAVDFLSHCSSLEASAKDALLAAKVSQAFYADSSRGTEPSLAVGDLVLVSTLHRRREYKKAGEHRAAKFFPRFDGPFRILKSHPESSSYTLDMPSSSKAHPTFYVGELRKYVANDDTLFPGRRKDIPPAVLVDGFEERFVERIIDARRRGRGWQFLVRYVNEGPGGDTWLPSSLVRDLAALDEWFATGGDGPDSLRFASS